MFENTTSCVWDCLQCFLHNEFNYDLMNTIRQGYSNLVAISDIPIICVNLGLSVVIVY